MATNMPGFDHGLPSKVPGQSLTMAPGSLPMEKPPQFVDPEQAAEFFWMKLHNPKMIIKLVIMLRKGVPAEFIARSILYTAIVHGIIGINTGLLMGRVLLKQIVAIGHLKGVKNMKVKNPDTGFLNFVSQYKDQLYDGSGDASGETPQDTGSNSQSLLSGI